MSDQRIIKPAKKSLAKPVTLIIVGVIVVFVLYLTFTSTYVVSPQENAVIQTFGRYTSTVGPGLHVKLPIPFQTVSIVPVDRFITEYFGFRNVNPGINSERSPENFDSESIMLTGDLNIIDVEYTVQYKINDPVAWLFNVDDPERTIRDISQSVMNQIVGDYSIFDVLRTEKTAIEQEAQQLMQEYFDSYGSGRWAESGMGIQVIAVRFNNALPPEGSVAQAFEDVNAAEQDMNRLINEGRTAYNQEVPRAQGEAEQILLQSQAYASERTNIAQGDASRFESVLAEYQRNPAVTRSRLYYEMVEEVFGETENINLIDRNLENYVPLGLLGNTGATATQEAAQ